MFPNRHMLCICLIIACDFGNVRASDSVAVELNSGQRIRGTAIERDTRHPDGIVVMIGNDQIQIRRRVAWNRIRKLSAPASMVAALTVPDTVQLLQSTSDKSSARTLDVNPATLANSETVTSVRDFLRIPNPVPDAPSEFGVLAPSTIAPFLPVEVPATDLPWPDPGGVMRRAPSDAGLFPSVPVMSDMPCGPLVSWIRDPGVVVGVRYADTGEVLVGAVIAPRQVFNADPRELAISARAFNRQGLADWNSLQVHVSGRTEDGLACPVRGSFKCALWVRRSQVVRAFAETYFEEPRDLFIWHQWSVFLDGTEQDATGTQRVVLALPQRSADQNLTISEFGVLTAELDIPGQGRLATTSEPISLRQIGPIRDRSVVDFGSIIFPKESVSEGRFDAGSWPAPLSGIRPDRRRFTVQP